MSVKKKMIRQKTELHMNKHLFFSYQKHNLLTISDTGKTNRKTLSMSVPVS